MNLQDALFDYVTLAADKVQAIEEVRSMLHLLHPNRDQPVDYVRWIHIDLIEPNDYNPNAVAQIEMRLLYTSIEHDGYTQPVVVIYDPGRGKYIIVDGFHRYYVMKANRDIYEGTHGYLPCVVIEKDINDRMASTIRHNRARGKHSVQGMSNLVFQMLDNGWSDAEICNQLGMEAEELLRLKHITGFSKLFADVEYNRAWVTRRQILIERARHSEEARKAGNDGTQANGET